MEQDFKFELGQYVRLSDNLLKSNSNFPSYPCKITYRFFDGKYNVYIVDFGECQERCVLEHDIQLYGVTETNRAIGNIQKLIYQLQERIINLELALEETLKKKGVTI